MSARLNMLTIRREQIEIFQQEMDKRFLEETVALLRKEHTKQVASLAENVLRERVAKGLHRARKYGIKSKYQRCKGRPDEPHVGENVIGTGL